MKRQLLFSFFILTLASCNNSDDLNKNVTSRTDTLTTSQNNLYKVFDDCLRSLKINKLSNTDSLENKFRFYYIGSFDGYYQFYEVNFSDSSLVKKYFYFKDPAGMYKDTLCLTDSFMLNRTDINKINTLIDRSMVWSLETGEHSNYLDCSFYIYESVRPKKNYYSDYKTHCLVIRHCPQNSDFVNLGEFLKSKTKTKNHYIE